MRIKYTGWYGQITAEMFDKIHIHFVRNVWKDIPEKYGKRISKGRHFLCENDLIFTDDIVGAHILIQRNCALGDLIQLIPVIKFLKKHKRCKFSLLTNQIYVNFNTWLDIYECVYHRFPEEMPFDRYIILDGILENDHCLDQDDRFLHRIKIYEKFFDIKIDDYDFKPNGEI